MVGGIGRISYGGVYGSVAAYMQPGSLRPGPASEEELSLGGLERDVQKGIDDPLKKAKGKEECQTCKNRKYQDGSDENVSFKSASKIDPNAVEARVRAHEQEHVANAYDKAQQMNGKVLRASVSLKFAICPECGRTYCAGGTTSTAIQYNKENPYEKNKVAMGDEAFKGNNLDEAV
ncbi:MAG: hypothetical protein IKI75_10945 [Lachnospiraceae bacterium]|nr:hypothetical protein [Lachnospiraceae bacterium]